MLLKSRVINEGMAASNEEISFAGLTLFLVLLLICFGLIALGEKASHSLNFLFVPHLACVAVPTFVSYFFSASTKEGMATTLVTFAILNVIFVRRLKNTNITTSVDWDDKIDEIVVGVCLILIGLLALASYIY